MNAAQSLFLQELNNFEGVHATAKMAQPLFREALDEVRSKFLATARRELDALHSIDAHKRRDNYGLKLSGWWKEEADKRIRISVKDGTKVLELQEGKTAWLLPSPEAGCRFLAGLIEAAERKELDRFLTVKPKKDKKSFYSKYITDVKAHRRAQQAESSGLDVSKSALGTDAAANGASQ